VDIKRITIQLVSILLEPLKSVVRIMLQIDRVDGLLGALGVVFFPVLFLYGASLLLDGLMGLGLSGFGLGAVFLLLSALVLVSALAVIPLMSLRSGLTQRKKPGSMRAAAKSTSQRFKELLERFARIS
jgi:hypothetical protein